MTTEPFLRVERGSLTAEEIAAVTVALLAMTGCHEGGAPRVECARWRRLERSLAFQPRHSWQLAR